MNAHSETLRRGAAAGSGEAAMSADIQTLQTAEPVPAAAAGAPATVPQLSFAFCKRHGVLIQSVTDGVADAVYRAGAQPASIAEVRRVLRIPLQLRRVDAEQFD